MTDIIRNPNTPLRVAVIGVGHMGKEHARIYSSLPDVQLVAVVDPERAAGEAVARRCKTSWLPRAEDLPDSLDAVSVAAPTSAHHALCKPLLERGISVLVEKPITDRLEDAEDLIRAARAGGALLQVGHIERFNPAIAAIVERRIQPLFIECHRLSPFRFRSLDVGVVFDLMIHDIDIIRSLVGSEITHIDAAGVNVLAEHEDIANARLTFQNGCVANVTASRISVKSMRKIRLFAKECYVSLDYEARKALIYRKSKKLTQTSAALRQATKEGKYNLLAGLKQLAFGDLLEIEDVKLDDYEPLKREIESFLHSVRTGEPPVVSGEDGCEAVRIATAILAEIRRTAPPSG